tara:strand:+ start:2311 stop:2478 length:168 start_codon:yes stop_codon:yes gene_type:complete
MTKIKKDLKVAIELLERAKGFLFGLSTNKDDPAKKLGHEIHQFVSRQKKNETKGK